jgi:glycosyltransferase involved in cell wall biosynthesis
MNTTPPYDGEGLTDSGTPSAAERKVPLRMTRPHSAELDTLLCRPVFAFRLNEARLVQDYRDRSQSSRVSVIMPTWNRAFIVRRAIDSVLRQSYRNLELILVDDGSTDETETVVRTAYGNDPRFLYVRETHRGVGHARNVGLTCGTGELVAYLDSDNEWSEHYLLLLVNALLDRPGASTAYCGVRVANNIEGHASIRLRPYDRKALLERNYIDLNVFIHRMTLAHTLGGFRDDIAGLEDWELIIRFTRDHPPRVVECVLATYYLEKNYGHLSLAGDLMEKYWKVRRLHPEPAPPPGEPSR